MNDMYVCEIILSKFTTLIQKLRLQLNPKMEQLFVYSIYNSEAFEIEITTSEI